MKNQKSSDQNNIIIPALAGVFAVIIIGIFIAIFAYFGADQPSSGIASDDNSSLDQDNLISTNRIDLSDQTSDFIISESGNYMLTGEFTHSIIVDADQADVKLILDNTTINSSDKAAIIGLAAHQITISTTKDSVNKLSDGGNSEYDGCIFSNAELIFEGEGVLEVNGQQEEGEGIATEAQPMTFNSGTYRVTSADDGINAGGNGNIITFNGGTFYINAGGDGIDSNKDAVINGGTIFVIGSDTGGDAGIDTDNGFTINGGTVIALGSDMIETPLTDSRQYSLALTLSQNIAKDTIVALLDSENNPVISFSAPKSFRTIVISTPDLTSGNYTISTGGTYDGTLQDGIYQGGTYTGGNLISIDGTTTFVVEQITNTYGNSGGPGGRPPMQMPDRR